MAENKKCKELFKGNRRNHKEINRCDSVSVVTKEGLPGLRWPISPRYHVLRDCRLGDLEAELQKLTMDVRRTPERVLETHSSDQGRARPWQFAVDRQEDGTSIARTHRSPCDANARWSRALRLLWGQGYEESDDKAKRTGRDQPRLDTVDGAHAAVRH